MVSFERMCTLALTAGPRALVLWYLKVLTTLEVLSSSSMATTGKDVLLKSARTALLELEVWASAAALALVVECVAATAEGSAAAEDLEGAEDLEVALAAVAASAEVLVLVLVASMVPRRPLLHPTRSPTTLPLELNAAKLFTSAT